MCRLFFVMAEIRIGTSGYSYKHWRGRYYPVENALTLKKALAPRSGERAFDSGPTAGCRRRRCAAA